DWRSQELFCKGRASLFWMKRLPALIRKERRWSLAIFDTVSSHRQSSAFLIGPRPSLHLKGFSFSQLEGWSATAVRTYSRPIRVSFANPLPPMEVRETCPL